MNWSIFSTSSTKWATKAGCAGRGAVFFSQIRRILVIAADVTSIMLMRGRPRTGNLPFPNGCFMDRAVASTALRKLLGWSLSLR